MRAARARRPPGPDASGRRRRRNSRGSSGLGSLLPLGHLRIRKIKFPLEIFQGIGLTGLQAFPQLSHFRFPFVHGAGGAPALDVAGHFRPELVHHIVQDGGQAVGIEIIVDHIDIPFPKGQAPVRVFPQAHI